VDQGARFRDAFIAQTVSKPLRELRISWPCVLPLLVLSLSLKAQARRADLPIEPGNSLPMQAWKPTRPLRTAEPGNPHESKKQMSVKTGGFALSTHTAPQLHPITSTYHAAEYRFLLKSRNSLRRIDLRGKSRPLDSPGPRITLNQVPQSPPRIPSGEPITPEIKTSYVAKVRNIPARSYARNGLSIPRIPIIPAHNRHKIPRIRKSSQPAPCFRLFNLAFEGTFCTNRTPCPIDKGGLKTALNPLPARSRTEPNPRAPASPVEATPKTADETPHRPPAPF
jgi:hypothetical protein